MTPRGDLPGILIPVYQPESGLEELVRRLLEDPYPCLIVVNDGSDQVHHAVFDRLADLERVEVVEHLVNLGKGEALKTGLNHAFVKHPELSGMVTVDADGQHLPDDVRRVAEELAGHPDHLCLGVRTWEGDVPWKSKVGNTCSRWVLYLLTGKKLSDTQTGLRGISRDFAGDLLRLRTSRYEFELEMLLQAFEKKRPLLQIPIQTVYHDENAGSHFDPFLDSLRVYFVFFRFLLSSLLTAVLDFAVFSLAYQLGATLLASVASGRVVAGVFNFLVNQRMVFKGGRHPVLEAFKYVGLVLTLMAVSYTLTLTLIERLGMNVFLAKVLVEGSLFLVSFALQRIYVFASKDAEEEQRSTSPRATDWDSYYERPAPTARITRKITERALIRSLRLGQTERTRLLEFGGGNSCFYDAICEAIDPARYTVVDKNETGLALFERNHGTDPRAEARQADILDLPAGIERVDTCFSVGLIEHFDESDTRRAIDAHFASTRPGGLVVLFFPTGTWLYRAARKVLELFGLWGFPDERPLPMAEVLRAVEDRGRVIYRGINWWIVLTQGIVCVEVTDAQGREAESPSRD